MTHPLPILEVQNLTVAYSQSAPVLQNIDLALPPNKVIGIIGPNGAGKSTLLKAAMGLVGYQQGVIRLLGQPIEKVRRWISYVPQKESIDWDFPASVFDIVLLGRYNRLKFFERPKKADKEAAMQCIEQVGMLALAHKQIGELSGGQQQRILLARALAQDAQLYFMDEPFTGVDITTEKTMVQLLKSMVVSGKTIVVVHHNLGSVQEYFDTLVLLNETVIAIGDTSEVFTADLLQKTYGSQLPLFRNYTKNSQPEW